LRKARSQNARLQVMVDSDWAQSFSQLLWTAPQADFFPHGILCKEQEQRSMNRTPVWLDALTETQVQCPVIVNMTSRPVPQGEPLIKIIEIVSTDPQAVLDARKRWRLYLDRGWLPAKHTAGA
jgi:DNA polymerase IIIc chi subunit